MKNVELAQRYFDAWNSRDLGTLRELLDPQVKLIFPRETFGLDELVRSFENAPASGPEHLDVSFVDRKLEEEGTRIVSTVKRVYRWKETGEHANTMRVQTTLTFRDGRIVKVELAPPEAIPDE